jgi:putative ABC transport system permease protein
MLLEGGVDNVRNGNGLLAGYELAKENQWNTGDIVTLEYGGKVLELPVSGILSDTPFQAEGGEWVVICSEPIFVGLTGEKDYTVIEMQVHEDISSQIRSVIPTELRLLDRQKGNGEVQAAYYTMSVFVYGFMFVIGLVSFINILNMVNAGVSNRMGNYGVMRAVGASCWQLKKVIAAEAATYVVTGCTAGSIIGLFLHNIFYTMLITENWGETWHPPLMVLLVTLLAAALATLMAVVAPAKKIEGMSIVSVVNAD